MTTAHWAKGGWVTQDEEVKEIFEHLPKWFQEAIVNREPTQEEKDMEREAARDRAIPVTRRYGRSTLFKS